MPGHHGQCFLPTAHSQKEPKQRIRVAEHPLEIYLLFAVGTRLLLSHNAPATDAELMESERHWSREIMAGSQGGRPSSVPVSKAPMHELWRKVQKPGFTPPLSAV